MSENAPATATTVRGHGRLDGVDVAKPTCSTDGCDRPVQGRGLCYRHYKDARASGSISFRGHPKRALMDLVHKTDGCWLWQGYVMPSGYGRAGRAAYAHREVYKLLAGPIPEGMTVDHECHNRATDCTGGDTCLHRRCVRPDHLVLRTLGDNARSSPTSVASLHKAKTHCPQGHPYDETNTQPIKTGGRRCGTCNRERAAAYRIANPEKVRDTLRRSKAKEPK